MDRQRWSKRKYQTKIKRLENCLKRKSIESDILIKKNLELQQQLLDIQETSVVEESRGISAIFSSGEFWEELYKNGGTSGNGSYNHLAEFKAEVVNEFIEKNNVQSIIELGCGDGNQLSYMNYPQYVGIDVSPYVIKKNKETYLNDLTKAFYERNDREAYMGNKYDLSISLDVIFHLLEEDVYNQYMIDLFNLSKKFVIIYSSNHEAYTPWPEFRHRNFMYHFQQYEAKNWELIQYIPNKYPYLIGCEKDTSCSDFYIFKRR